MIPDNVHLRCRAILCIEILFGIPKCEMDAESNEHGDNQKVAIKVILYPDYFRLQDQVSVVEVKRVFGIYGLTWRKGDTL